MNKAELGAYVVDYRCETAHVFSWHCRAYSVEHALEKFWESDAHAVPWAIVCVRRPLALPALGPSQRRTD